MYKKYLITYKPEKHLQYNSFTICIEWKDVKEIEEKKKIALHNFKTYPIEAKSWKWEELYWFWIVPISINLT